MTSSTDSWQFLFRDVVSSYERLSGIRILSRDSHLIKKNNKVLEHPVYETFPIFVKEFSYKTKTLWCNQVRPPLRLLATPLLTDIEAADECAELEACSAFNGVTGVQTDCKSFSPSVSLLPASTCKGIRRERRPLTDQDHWWGCRRPRRRCSASERSEQNLRSVRNKDDGVQLHQLPSPASKALILLTRRTKHCPKFHLTTTDGFS